MGVTGLWDVLQPCARPVKLEALNRQRLAIDASIWIYQFLKAVRDKEGNALRNSHVVGFFRRICKLLFIGIQPVFVFDGGAPALKRQTISKRRARREGKREDATRTASRLLALQMQRRAEEDREKQRQLQANRERQDDADIEAEAVPDDMAQLVYQDELGMSERERQQNRAFKKTDAYHLPAMETSFAEMGQPGDPRIMSQAELEAYARQFHAGEDINLYDFSKIDFDGPFFRSLPASDRYNILNAARLRSRLRMGYSKEQLEDMFPDRMAFSRFQIERVRERNELTQRLMNLNGMNADLFSINGRIAGEKGKEYVLVKNDGVEGGWALGVVSNNRNEGEAARPIDVDKIDNVPKEEDADDDEWEDTHGMEDVPIEGLNRLPKLRKRPADQLEDLSAVQKREAFYKRRREAIMGRKPAQDEVIPTTDEDPSSLFLPEIPRYQDEDEDDDLFEDVLTSTKESDEAHDLARAVALSLDRADEDSRRQARRADRIAMMNGPDIDKPLDFSAKNAKVGKAFARYTNARAQEAATGPFQEDSGSDDAQSQEENAADADLKAAIELSRQPLSASPDEPSTPPKNPTELLVAEKKSPEKHAVAKEHQFEGPLPFETLNLGKSLLGKKRKRTEREAEGGFEREEDEAAQPLPPWFSTDVRDNNKNQRALEDRQAISPKLDEQARSAESHPPILRREPSRQVIDLDEPETQKSRDRVDDKASEGHQNEDDDLVMGESRPAAPIEILDEVTHMSDLAERARALPPDSAKADSHLVKFSSPSEVIAAKQSTDEEVEESPELAKIAHEQTPEENSHYAPVQAQSTSNDSSSPYKRHEPTLESSTFGNGHSFAEPAGSQVTQANPAPQARTSPFLAPSHDAEDAMRSASPKFVDVVAPETALSRHVTPISPTPEFEDVEFAESQTSARPTDPNIPSLTYEDTYDRLPADEPDLESDDYSDPGDEELMRQLAVEAEEHARFASSLTSKPILQSADDYDRELRQLRAQQRRERRDADEVTQVMVGECQQLLQLFGLPYMTAPMEAEAQCAELARLGLVDGIATDDADIFLFGGGRVYRHLFNQAKFVECYLTPDIDKELALPRDRVVQLAHLLGSDYAEGLPSVGPVTACEILAEFGTLDNFREWWSAVQHGGNTTLGDGTEVPSRSGDEKTAFRRKFRKNAAKLFLPPDFPDRRVDEAYLHPDVDSDPSAFAWGVPDLDAVRRFLMATVGWNQERADEILVPVVRDMNRRANEGTQTNVTRFFSGAVGSGTSRVRNGAAASSANEGSGSRHDTSETAEDETNASSNPTKRRRKPGKSQRLDNALERLQARAALNEGVHVNEESASTATNSAKAATGPEANASSDAKSKSVRTGRRGAAKPRRSTQKSKARRRRQSESSETTDDHPVNADEDDTDDDD